MVKGKGIKESCHSGHHEILSFFIIIYTISNVHFISALFLVLALVLQKLDPIHTDEFTKEAGGTAEESCMKGDWFTNTNRLLHG
jgi:hypothetical protein